MPTFSAGGLLTPCVNGTLAEHWSVQFKFVFNCQTNASHYNGQIELQHFCIQMVSKHFIFKFVASTGQEPRMNHERRSYNGANETKKDKQMLPVETRKNQTTTDMMRSRNGNMVSDRTLQQSLRYNLTEPNNNQQLRIRAFLCSNVFKTNLR
jgi:hypothetical protein